MAGLGWLRAGTIAVTNGGRNVGGTDTIWSGGVVNSGDIILLPNGTLGEIESVSSNTTLTLKQAYTGATASAQPYAIIRMLPSGNVAADLAAGVQALVQRAGATFDQLFELLDSYGVVSFSDGTTTLSGLHGLRKLMADIAAALPKTGGTVTGSVTVQGALGIGTAASVAPLNVYGDFGGPAAAAVAVFQDSVNKLLMAPRLGGGSYSVLSNQGDFGVLASETSPNYGLVIAKHNGGAIRLGTPTEPVTIAAGGSERIRLNAVGGVSTNDPFKPGQYTLATLPSASSYNGYTITVSNASGGPALCLSNGSSWINIRTNAPVN